MNSRGKIIDYLQKNGATRPVNLLKFLKISEVAFYKQIKKLLADGVVIKAGARPHALYSISKTLTLQTLKKQIVPILLKNSVTKAAFFGSFARGDHRPDSDIDLLVSLAKNKSLLDLISLEQDLEDKFQKDFDLVTYQSLNSKLKSHVHQDLIPIL